MGKYEFFSQGPAQWGMQSSLSGASWHLSLLRSFHATSITQLELSSLTGLKAWGEPEKFKSKVTFLLILTRGCTEGTKCLASLWYGYTCTRPGHPPWGRQTVNPTTLHWAWLSLWLGVVQWRNLPCARPQWGAAVHPGCGRNWHCCLQKGQSTTGMSTPQLWFPGHLSSRTQWVWCPTDNLPTRANGQRNQPTQWQPHLSKGWHPSI